MNPLILNPRLLEVGDQFLYVSSSGRWHNCLIPQDKFELSSIIVSPSEFRQDMGEWGILEVTQKIQGELCYTNIHNRNFRSKYLYQEAHKYYLTVFYESFLGDKMKNPHVEIFLDQDGPLADFNKRVSEVLEKPLTGHSNHIDWELLAALAPTLFEELPLSEGALELFNAVAIYRPKVLTAIPRTGWFPGVTHQKRTWVHKNLGLHVHTLFGPFAEDKQFHCAGPNSILIDDNPKNVTQWEAKGGVGIFYESHIQTLNDLRQLGVI